MDLYVESIGPKGRRNYRKAHRQEVLEIAATYRGRDLVGVSALERPAAVADYLRQTFGAYEHEVFGVVYLDNRHRVIAQEVLFRGTIDGSSVHPREVVKAALMHNAAALIFFHNHPSGVLEPSNADEHITRRLKDSLALVDIRVLDHVIVSTQGHTSFSERGLL